MRVGCITASHFLALSSSHPLYRALSLSIICWNNFQHFLAQAWGVCNDKWAWQILLLVLWTASGMHHHEHFDISAHASGKLRARCVRDLHRLIHTALSLSLSSCPRLSISLSLSPLSFCRSLACCVCCAFERAF